MWNLMRLGNYRVRREERMDLEVQEGKNNQILTPKEISKILKISMDKTYELIQSPGFPKLKIGRQYRIPEEEFNKWIKRYSYNQYII